MKIVLLAGLPLLLLAVAGAPGVAAADVVSVRTLPAAKLPGSLDLPRAQAPEHIAATEKLEGFYPALPPAATQKRIKERGGYRYVYVFPTEAQAREYDATGDASAEPDKATAGANACLTSGSYFSGRLWFSSYTPPPPPKPGSKEWLAEQKKKTQAVLAAAKAHRPLTPAPPPAKPITVRAVRSERFNVGADGGATLEVVDAWLDTESLGMRLVSRASIPFARVAKGPSGLDIYGGRDDQQVNLFVTPPRVPQQEGTTPPSLHAFANRIFAQSSSGFSTQSDCGATSIALRAYPGSGQMAAVVANAFLAPAPEDAADLATERSPGDEEERRMAGLATRTVRTRPVVANLSLSQLATETDPTLSITFAWAGHDQQHNF